MFQSLMSGSAGELCNCPARALRNKCVTGTTLSTTDPAEELVRVLPARPEAGMTYLPDPLY